jgi:hypothetical protein
MPLNNASCFSDPNREALPAASTMANTDLLFTLGTIPEF